MSQIKKLYGIDTLYFFFESNENYDDLFLDILDQIEDIKGKFEKREIEYENNDISITIEDIHLNYLGKKEGFYWFKDLNEFFRIGFKDKYKNRGLNDIRVQLQGNGIYTLGISSLITLLKDMLKGYICNYIPVTRADINCFIQYDLSFISKDMFSTRKRKYSTINEIGDANSTQTIYVGKEPFKLRIYNKGLELKKSKKYELMNEYFLNNDLSLDEPLFNIEFQMNRTHLRAYEILTVEDLLHNAKNLFNQAMEDIRLIDTTSITEDTLKHNKYKAKTHSLWQEVKDEFNIVSFLQSSVCLKRVKRKVSIYDENKFEFEYIALLRKAFINNLLIDSEYLDNLFIKAKDSLNKTTSNKELKKRYIDIEVINPDNSRQHLRQLEDKTIIEPIKTISLSTLSDYDLLRYLEKVQLTQHESKRNKDIYEVALKEALKRDLVPNVSTKEVHYEHLV
ncbi:MAG: hypothetical protein HWD90_11000 [Campylobacteraceae bacterium]|nr:hypothetical protein [Campylobacteraceae bacterium]